MEAKSKLYGILTVSCGSNHKSLSAAYNAILALGLDSGKVITLHCSLGFLLETGVLFKGITLILTGVRHGKNSFFLETIINGTTMGFVPLDEKVELRLSGYDQ